VAIIHVDNSTCQIRELSKPQFDLLRRELSAPVDRAAAIFGSGCRLSDRRYLVGKRGTFGTGLLVAVRRWLKARGIPLTIRDVRKKPHRHLGMFRLNLED
jgi:hypothetical protein